jgi:hypothetical protein
LALLQEHLSGCDEVPELPSIGDAVDIAALGDVEPGVEETGSPDVSVGA